MTFSAKKNIAIITGAAGGIGNAITHALSENMSALVLVDLNYEKMNLLRDTILKKSTIPILCFKCDVGNGDAVNAMLDQIHDQIGIPTLLINNAGIGGPFHRIDEVIDEEWFSIINTNLKSIFNFSRYLLPKMKTLNYGKIINIASVQGYLGATRSSTYVASKHGVIGYTRAIAAEWGAYGITCNAICPGYVDTRMGIQDNQVDDHFAKVINKTPIKRIATPNEIAALVKQLTLDELSFINGAVLTIDGGLTCHVGID